MAAVTSVNLRLPGVYFLPPPPPPNLALPPLDAAGFVGFAARGPLDTPVPVDDPATYAAVFGSDTLLARQEDGSPVYGALPAVIAGFFANGGRRAYVVRVAGDGAQAAQFPLSGMARIDGLTAPSAASIAASSEGVWANAAQAAPRLSVTPLPATAFQIAAPASGTGGLNWQAGGAPGALQAGDLLRLTLADGSRWLAPIAQITENSDGSRFLRVDACWQSASPDALGSGAALAKAQRILPGGAQNLALTGANSTGPGRVALFGADAAQLQRGDFLQLQIKKGAAYLLRVDALSPVTAADGSPLPDAVILASEALVLAGKPLSKLPSSALAAVARLQLEIAFREGALRRPAIVEAGFNAAHPRFWGQVALLESSPLHQPSAADASGEEAEAAAQTFAQSRSETRPAQAVDSSLAPQDVPAFAGTFAPLTADASAGTFLPVGMPSVLTDADLAGPFQPGADGLENYGVGWFFDPLLIPRLSGPGGEVFDHPASGAALLANAEYAYFTQEKRLRGLHSLMFVDEVGLACLPDAAQPQWRLPDPPPVPVVTSPPAPPPPDRTKFDSCPDDFIASPPVSPPVVSPPAAPVVPVVDAPPDDASIPQPLLDAHRGLIQFCEARQNVLGVLSLPVLYEKRQCLAWEQAMRRYLGLPLTTLSNGASGLTDLSYAAVYHPWPQAADASAPDGLRAVPPDGVVTGMIAARERARQVWAAPANTPLTGVLGLTPRISEDDRADLFAAQFNMLHTEPRDFRVMSAHTLSDERVLRQISVRRLLIVLRKAALLRGQEFVFQNNNAYFREGVRQTLDSLLQKMFAQGAFAGSTAALSYRIVTDASVNPPQGVDLGQLVIQIQIAPSQPAEFITVQLLRAGDSLQAVGP